MGNNDVYYPECYLIATDFIQCMQQRVVLTDKKSPIEDILNKTIKRQNHKYIFI